MSETAYNFIEWYERAGGCCGCSPMILPPAPYLNGRSYNKTATGWYVCNLLTPEATRTRYTRHTTRSQTTITNTGSSNWTESRDHVTTRTIYTDREVVNIYYTAHGQSSGGVVVHP